MKRIMSLTAALALLVVVQSAGATPLFTNGGFEANPAYMQDLSGWTVDTGALGMGSAKVKTAHVTSLGNTYSPVEGANLAVLTAGDLVVDNSGAPVPGMRATTMRQDFTITALSNKIISGFAAFDAFDYGSFGDFGYVRVLDSVGAVLAQPFYSEVNVNTAVNFDGPWTQWFWTTMTPGTYTLEFGVANVGDDPAFPAPWNSSMLLVDRNIDSAAVPEPSTFILSAAGLAGLAFLRRRSRKG